MEYRRKIKSLNNTPDEPSKLRKKNWVEINHDLHGTYSTNSQIKFKTTMWKSSLCHYSDTYILAKGTITLVGQEAIEAATQAERNNKHINNKHYTINKW